MTDNKGETMIIKINPEPLFTLLGDNGEHWIQGQWGDDEQMCLHGAILRCQPIPGDAFIIQQVAEAQGWGPEWNDDDDTTWETVKDQILSGIEITDEMLEDTFGFQWQEIVALVRRAAVLTSGEAEQFLAASDPATAAAWAAARDAAWDAARNTAWNAAWAAAWDAARNAAWNAAWAAAWAAARDAAQNAAWALAVRDLIGQHGFTQDHYDLLTGSWRSVIGPVHPDDKEARRG